MNFKLYCGIYVKGCLFGTRFDFLSFNFIRDTRGKKIRHD